MKILLVFKMVNLLTCFTEPKQCGTVRERKLLMQLSAVCRHCCTSDWVFFCTVSGKFGAASLTSEVTTSERLLKG